MVKVNDYICHNDEEQGFGIRQSREKKKSNTKIILVTNSD